MRDLPGDQARAAAVLPLLRETVERLAAPAATQASWLTREGFPVEELMLELDDHIPGRIPLLVQEGVLSEPTQRAILQLFDAFDALRGPANAELWRLDGLAHSHEWQHIRELARGVLRGMDGDSATDRSRTWT